jgi:hypothetical protein
MEHTNRKPNCGRFITFIYLQVTENKCVLRQFSIQQAIKTNGVGYESV